jgi:TrpR family trp operon transcriptional repressor
MTRTALKELVHCLHGLSSPKEIEGVLSEILTPAEIQTITQRWNICKLLLQGVSQREIARRLGVSLCNITRGAREMRNPGSRLRELLETRCWVTDTTSPKKGPLS